MCVVFISELHIYHTDSRQCQEKIQGPFQDEHYNKTRIVLPLPTNENNSVTIRCHVVCQEANAFYTPQLRIVTTEEGQFYENNWRKAVELFEVISPHSGNRFACDPANNATNYEFQVTLNSPKANRSIAICGLFYQSVSENFTEHCYTDRVAWIMIHDEASATPPPPTADAINTSATSSSFETTKTEESNNSFSAEISVMPFATEKPSVGFVSGIPIPGEAAIVFIIAAVVVTIVAGVLLVFLVILYKRRQQNSRETDVEAGEVEDCVPPEQTDNVSSSPARLDQGPLQILDVSHSTQTFRALAQIPQPLIVQNNGAVTDELSQQDILPNAIPS